MKRAMLWLGRACAVVVALSAAGVANALPPSPELDNWKGPKNNCYNYAINRKDNDFKQPGGLPWPGAGGAANLTVQEWCDKVKARAQNDGLVWIDWRAGQAIPTPPTGYNLVALGALAGTKGYDDDTDGDYHWWRLNGDGSWSHKRGKSAAKTTYTDNMGREQPLTDPRNAAQTDGYTLCGFMGVPKNPMPANHIDPGLQAPSSGVRVWHDVYSGFEGHFADYVGSSALILQSHMPTLSPSNEVTDPHWVDPQIRGDFGYDILPGAGMSGFGAYSHYYQGIVAVYSDIDGNVIHYYHDDHGLGGVIPAPGGIAAFGLAGALALRRRR